MVCVVSSSVAVFASPVAPAAAAALVGGAVVVAAGVAVVAAGALVVAGEASADAALRAIGDWGEVVSRRADERLAADRTLQEWHMAAADAVGLNALITLTGRRAAQLGQRPDLPRPLDLAGRTLSEVAGWILATQTMVEKARAELDRTGISAEWRTMVASLPAASRPRPSLAAALADRQRAIEPPHPQPEPSSPAAAVVRNRADEEFRAALDTEVAQIVGQLDRDTTPVWRQQVLDAAAKVLSNENRIDAGMYLASLRRTAGRASRSGADRRSAATWLQVLEHPTVAAARIADPDPAWTRSVGLVRAVVSGDAELSERDRVAAMEAVAWAVEATQIRYRQEQLVVLLTKQGFQITELIPGSARTELVLRRAGWDREHTASLWFTTDAELHLRLVRETTERGDDVDAREAARQGAVWNQVENALHEMSHRGITGIELLGHAVQRRHDPSLPATTEVKWRTSEPGHRSRPTGSH